MTDPMKRTAETLRTSAPEPGTPLALAVEQAREHAIRVLSDGFAYDALNEDEFEWRLGQLSLANSPAEVQALIADLPTVGGSAATLAYQDQSGAPATTDRIFGLMSDVRREGIWHLPQRLRVSAIMSSVRVDLRQATIPPGCVIEVRAIMANVSILVPPGLPVQFDVTPVMGTARNDSTRIPALRGAPLVRVSGSAIMAEVRVRVRGLRS